jgi:leucyl-tRNA synthetase
MQKNWIGRSEGLLIRFALESNAYGRRDELEVYTTRPTRCSARSSWRSRPIIRWPRKPPKQSRCRPSSRSASAPAPRRRRIDKAEKLGFDTGIRAVHPLDPNWTLPVYVANFVLMEYGTGAIFGCPAA